MNKDIGDIVMTKLSSLPWFDKYAGVIKVLSFTDTDKDGKVIRKKMPVNCRSTQLECSSGRYIDLCPDSTKKSVAFLKDKGVRFVEVNGNSSKWKAAFDLVCWINADAIGYENCSYSGIAIQGILSKLSIVPFHDGIYQHIRIQVFGQLPEATNPFAEYNFEEDITQYLMHPYEVFTLPIEVDFSINKNCISVADIDSPINCTRLIPATFKVTIKDRITNEILQEFTTSTTYYVDVLREIVDTITNNNVTIIEALN
jgi:hypothetical protein